MSEKHYTFDGQEDPHFETELELRMWMAGKNSEIAAQRERELARLQDETEQLKELWRQFIAAESRGESQRAVDVIEQAAALLAGTPAEDSE